jgi:hypothetical protein
MSVCVHSVFVLSCVPCDRLIPRPRSAADCVKDQGTEKAAKVQQRAVQPYTEGWLRTPNLLLALISGHVYLIIIADVVMRLHGCELVP